MINVKVHFLNSYGCSLSLSIAHVKIAVNAYGTRSIY